jgi:hypothetical protein
MSEKDLRGILESSNDKLSVFADRDTLASCDNLTEKDLISLIDNYLNDSQKLDLLNFEHFRKLRGQVRVDIAMSISDSNLRLQLLLTPDGPFSDLYTYQFNDLLESLDSSCKLKLLKNSHSLQSLKLGKDSIESMAKSLSDSDKFTFLSDIDYLNEELKLSEYSISRIICSVNDEKVKLHLLDVMPLDNYYKTDILTTISDTTKASIILNNTYDLKPHEASQVLGSMDTDFFIDYVNEHTDFFSKNGISIQSVVRYFPMKEQISFANKIYNINISVR